MSIGRSSGNDWVLADPDQHLSRTHCMIGFEDGRYAITDLSTNGMHINGAREPTTRDSRIVLTDGDTVRLGGYVMEVTEIPDHAGAGSRFGASEFLSSRADPFGASGTSEGGNPLDADPLDDPLSMPPARGFQHPLPHLPPSVRRDDPFDDHGRSGGGRSDDDLFGSTAPSEQWRQSTPREAADAVSNAYTPPRVLAVQRPEEIDFDALLGDVMPGAPPAPPNPPPAARRAAPVQAAPLDDLDDLLGDLPPQGGKPAAAPPAPAPVAAPAAPPPAAASPFDEPLYPSAPVIPAVPTAAPAAVPAPQAAAAPAAPDALLAAFLEGAGLTRPDLSAGDQEAMMRAIGALFRAFVTGTRDVLMSRAEIKHEMRVEQTMMRARDNNALKFSVSPEEAMAALLRPRHPGYKAPLASVEEAFDDIRSHEMAVMAGLQTGLIALMKRFDPAGLESRLQRGMLDGILPGQRKARFWELFCTTYKDIAREAEDDFHAVFGRDFARAYNAQINKL